MNPSLFISFASIGLLFGGEFAHEVGQIETDNATEHGEDYVNREGLTDATEDFAEILTSGGEDLVHQRDGWVEGEVISKPEEGRRYYVTNYYGDGHAASNDCTESKCAALVFEGAGKEETDNDSA